MYYDPMISKLIVWGKTREEAIRRMRRALYEYKITGVKTSIKFLERIMQADAFISGKYNTHFIDDNIEFLTSRQECDRVCEDLAVITAFLDYQSQLSKAAAGSLKSHEPSRWKVYGRHSGMYRI